MAPVARARVRFAAARPDACVGARASGRRWGFQRRIGPRGERCAAAGSPRRSPAAERAAGFATARARAHAVTSSRSDTTRDR
ncbi:hypothetical protein V4E86_25875 [Burkholderia pseudomallei]|uniref:Uncharacterized protein n=4 Tax=pseudomallei group TaxID=111527 RepID=A0AAX1XBG1_BURML|nr:MULTISPECIES: hypothetical protein [pseudomallei group]ABN87586.1 hypothetical protein BURPS668_A1411 [Burkholderia pseudomallei 668]ABN94947.1 hypothetical protein BURPS1106A_A1330 [Burkholderia pseudomallei 1106a]EDK55403.1 hypothetical protein BMAFMH_E0458 [Burkholderia mallei FMH]EDK61339.1 hypothetical protein BMAJHU_I0368 [Burkholderia mallei JHU]EDK84084.1 hypothetical protein BMA721280_L0146 [Burkholderia mallei 2002721280]EDP85616.1 hypothetical protein BMA10399_G0282 [Burkholderi